MLKEWAEEAGVDLDEIKEEDELNLRRRRRHADNHALAKAGKKYANAASDWFRQFDQFEEVSDLAPTDTDVDEADRLVDAREIIHWYQYQIAVKTIRALSSRFDENEFDEVDDYPRD